MEVGTAEAFRLLVRDTIPGADLCPAVQSQANHSPSLDPESLPKKAREVGSATVLPPQSSAPRTGPRPAFLPGL